MANTKDTYKFGLYGRCPLCKEITKEVCEGCGSATAFSDSSKTGIVVCTECGLEHTTRCEKPSCSNQIKVLRTPKNADEKSRIDEFIYRKTNKDMDKRVYVIKETPKVKVVKEVSVDKKELEKEEKRKESIISLDSEIDMELIDGTGGFPGKEKPEEESGIRLDQSDITIDKSMEEISLKDEKQKISESDEEVPVKLEPTVEEQQELEKIKNFWKTKEMTEQEEKKEEERRIVNQFYDEQEDDVLDKKINFENIYNETAYFDCRVCGTEEQKIACEKCGQSNQFSLNYDALSCKCGNDIKVRTCGCGAKHGHTDFYLISDGIKWQYSKSKSYYNYRKGRMLVFSTCPTCGVFSVEKCKVCGSKVNFGIPNKNNEIYCKNCGSINQFLCENRNCNDTVKSLKNPNSIEQKLEWLNDVMNFRTKVSSSKVKYSEPGGKDKDKVKTSSSFEISIGGESTPDFTNSFIEEFDNKTKEMITSSFISEVENEVNQRKKLQDELKNFNMSQTGSAPKAQFGSPTGSKQASVPGLAKQENDEDDSGPSEIAFDDSGKSMGFYIMIVVIIIVLAVAAWFGFGMISGGEDTSASAAPEPPVQENVNAVQKHVDTQVQKVETAKEAVDKMNAAQEETDKAIQDIQ